MYTIPYENWRLVNYLFANGLFAAAVRKLLAFYIPLLSQLWIDVALLVFIGILTLGALSYGLRHCGAVLSGMWNILLSLWQVLKTIYGVGSSVVRLALALVLATMFAAIALDIHRGSRSEFPDEHAAVEATVAGNLDWLGRLVDALRTRIASMQ